MPTAAGRSNGTTTLSKNGKKLCEEGGSTIGKTTDAAKKQAKDDGQEDVTCPSYAVALEIVFITFTIILFIVSIVMLVMGCVMGHQQIKGCDGAYSAIAGILIIICGIMMIFSAAMIDKFNHRGMSEEEWVKYQHKNFPLVSEADWKKAYREGREEDAFALKICAGALALVDGIFYLVVCCIICMSSE